MKKLLGIVVFCLMSCNVLLAKILIIDEVSMLSRKIFEIIEEVARTIKKNTLPFGGMQIIFSGDFCQLPPVGTHGEQDTFQFHQQLS